MAQEADTPSDEADPTVLLNQVSTNPRLLLLSRSSTVATREAIFTQNCQIKNQICLLILDNGSMKNLISAKLVEQLQLSTKPQPSPYNLGWVTNNDPTNRVDRVCHVTFAVDPFIDTVICDVSPMDCCDLLLGKLYQFDRHATYDSVPNTYKLRKDQKTYIMTSSSRTGSSAPISTLTLVSDPEASRTALSAMVFQTLFVRQAPDAGSTPLHDFSLPSANMQPLLESHQDILEDPKGSPPSPTPQHTIDLIPRSSSPNGPVSKTFAPKTVKL